MTHRHTYTVFSIRTVCHPNWQPPVADFNLFEVSIVRTSNKYIHPKRFIRQHLDSVRHH